MVNIHFHPGSRSRSLSHRHHHHHHHGHHHHRVHTVIECGNSKICNGFFIFIFLAMIIGFIVAAVKGAFSKKKEHYSNCSNKSQNKNSKN